MKFIKNNSVILLFTLSVLLGAGTGACNKDEEIEVIPKTLEEYKSELSALVSSEKTIVQNCVVGYNKGDFKSQNLFDEYRNNYLSVLIATETVLNNPDLTITDIVKANMALTSPGKDFNDNIFQSDRRPIHEVIIFCDTLAVHTPEGTEPGLAPPDARNAFIAAITEAKVIRSSSATIDRQVTEAVEKLNAALEIFQDAIIKQK